MKTRVVSILTVVLVLAILLPATAFAASKAEKTYDKAQDALIDGKYEKAAELFESVSGYEDAAQCALYAKGLWYGSDGKYDDALKTLAFLGEFKDSVQLINYYTICKLADSSKLGDIFDAAEQFDVISAYRDSAERAENCRQRLYDEAAFRYNTGDYETAKWIFTDLGSFKDCAEQVQTCENAISEKKNADAYAKAESLLAQMKYDEAEAAFRALGEYKDSAARVDEVIEARNEDDYAKAESLLTQKKYDEAEAAFRALGGYKDSADRVSAVQNAKKDAVYQEAAALYSTGNYSGAYSKYLTLPGYKDVDILLTTDENLVREATAREAKLAPYKKVGSIVSIGSYEQDNDTLNGREEIEWIVLANEGSQSLLISRYALDTQPFNTELRHAKWDTCSLRTWLNETFLKEAFSAEEQKVILTTKVYNGKSQGNLRWITDYGNNTEDQIFLLSYMEANMYFSSISDRTCKPTTYAEAQGAHTSDNGDCDWWLRSPGEGPGLGSMVCRFGSMIVTSDSDDGCAVRPAFWINLESEIFW